MSRPPQILELIRELQDEFGMAIQYITHDLGVIAQIADDVAPFNGERNIIKGSIAIVVFLLHVNYLDGYIRIAFGFNSLCWFQRGFRFGVHLVSPGSRRLEVLISVCQNHAQIAP